MKQQKIEYWRAPNGLFYFHVKHANGKVTGGSQGYTTSGSALRRARQENPGLPTVRIYR